MHSVAHMLLVTEAQGGDAGQYRCTARNEVPDFIFDYILLLLSLRVFTDKNRSEAT